MFSPERIAAAVDAACAVAWPNDEAPEYPHEGMPRPSITDRDDLEKVIRAALTAAIKDAGVRQWGVRSIATPNVVRIQAGRTEAEETAFQWSVRTSEPWDVVHRVTVDIGSPWEVVE